MPVGKPAEPCREAFDHPQASHAAEMAIWDCPARGSNSLETLDRDPGQDASYCSHSAYIQDADDCIAVGHQCAHLRTCFKFLPVSVSALTMDESNTWQNLLDLDFAKLAEATWCFCAAVTVHRISATHQSSCCNCFERSL
ncbi:hypothetical protein CVIRNUC_011241 [Coccomyxa viridis]|uniref:Uncharacterized protein n=1 Tax=Coccomyxa viridis TaxID=1274662 RepID=A0AAV1ILK6_9CHLO|nr:hypothetical protein CVIRNUC_011241 [Coccomyxa viridis]